MKKIQNHKLFEHVMDVCFICAVFMTAYVAIVVFGTN